MKLGGRRRAALCMVLALVAGAGSGCGGSDNGSAPDAGDPGGIECEPGGSFALSGRAAVLALLNVHVNASGLVETDTTSELLLRLDIAQTGTALEVRATACSLDIPDVPLAGQDQPIAFDVPAATVESVGEVVGAATLSSPDQRCAELRSDPFTLVLGARLDPIGTAPLPAADEAGGFRACAPTAETTCDLAIGVNCACDQEGDARPGATLQAAHVPIVDLDEVYATLRARFSLSGVVLDSDRVIGTIDATLEQSILGCHLAAGDACSADQIGSVRQLNPAISQQPGNPSTFRAARVADDASCADIAAHKDELFPL